VACTHIEPDHYEVWCLRSCHLLACFGTEHEAEWWVDCGRPRHRHPRALEVLGWTEDAA
jgi:hypothetical protein